MTQHITLAEVKAACRKAYAEGRLIAQDVDGKFHGYRVGDRVCAIGAALTDETHQIIDEESLAAEIIIDPDYSLYDDHHLINTAFSWDEEDQKALFEIQNLHDNWTGARMSDVCPETIASYEDEFKALIGYTD